MTPKTRTKPKNGKAKRQGSEERTYIENELSKDAIFLQPWFLPREVYLAIRRVLPHIHLAKMRYYFEDYGCLKCGKKTALYQSNGLCEPCGNIIRHRMKRSLAQRLKEVGVTSQTSQPADMRTDGLVLAQRILSHQKRP